MFLITEIAPTSLFIIIVKYAKMQGSQQPVTPGGPGGKTLLNIDQEMNDFKTYVPPKV